MRELTPTAAAAATTTAPHLQLQQARARCKVNDSRSLMLCSAEFIAFSFFCITIRVLLVSARYLPSPLYVSEFRQINGFEHERLACDASPNNHESGGIKKALCCYRCLLQSNLQPAAKVQTIFRAYFQRKSVQCALCSVQLAAARSCIVLVGKC